MTTDQDRIGDRPGGEKSGPEPGAESTSTDVKPSSRRPRPTDSHGPRWREMVGLGIGLALFTIALILPVPDGMDPRGMRVLAVVALTAACWLTEALPIPVASLLPLVLFPLLGVMGSNTVASTYTNNLIFLFMGGFFLALTLEKWNLHRRLALAVLSVFGTRPQFMILGMMVAVAVLSMWISNTATALTMLPICLAMTQQLEEQGVDRRHVQRFSVALLLGVAYAANVGGMGTPIGTGPNGVFLQHPAFADFEPPSFAQWMTLCVPLATVFLLVMWWVLTKLLMRFPRDLRMGDVDFVRGRLRALGRMGREEKIVLGVFSFTVLLWVTRKDFDLGAFSIPGWVTLVGRAGLTWVADAASGIQDSVAAILAVVLLCVFRGRDGRPIADWEVARDIPWGMLLLLGGGFALAQGFAVHDEGLLSLSGWVGSSLEGVADWHPLLLIGGVCLVMTFLTELTSNTATTSVMLPILATVGSADDGRLLCLAATLSASCAFMLPVATPPNAIVFASNRFTMMTMARTGFVINLIGVVLITIAVATFGSLILPS